MRYKKRRLWKYRLHEDEIIQTKIKPPADLATEFIELTAAGVLTIKAGYCWDGPSGPTFDSPKTMTPSLAHDAVYNLIRDGWLDMKWRIPADYMIYDLLIERGVSKIRAGLWLKALKHAGAPSATYDVIEVP